MIRTRQRLLAAWLALANLTGDGVAGIQAAEGDPRFATLRRTEAASPAQPGARPSTRGWQSGTGFRLAPLELPEAGKPGFTLLEPTTTRVAFANRLADRTVATNRLYEIGSGVALGDIDGDGWVDLYFCGLESDNALYRNLGNWRFEDITAAAGVGCPNQFSTGCLLVDFDGDGDLDLLVTSLNGGTRAFRNDGRGHFIEDTGLGLFRRLGATSMAMADVDGDGDLDLYVTNYRTDTFFDHPPGLRMEMRQQPDGTQSVEPRDRFITIPTRDGVPLVVERGEPDVLYVNRGGGSFLAIPWNTGLFRDEDGRPLREPPTDWGLAAMFRDLNGDGLPDLYVCNDFVYWPDRLWLNEEGKRFRAAPRHALRSVSLASMAVDVADINRDGLDDIFVVDMLSPRRSSRAWQRPDTLREKVRWPREDPNFRPEVPRNTLHLARGDGTFAEIAQFAGVAATDWTPSALFLDVDLDGWEDLLIATGNLHDVQDVDALAAIGRSGGGTTPDTRVQNLAKLPSRSAPSMALRNRRDLRFEDVSGAWGFNSVGVAHGMALGDLDNDGDLDVVVNCMNAPARIHRNDSHAPRVAVRLRGTRENTRGIGGRIKVLGGPVTQTQEMIAGGRFCSSDDPMRVFATGDARELKIEVTWRNGTRSVVADARPNHVYEIAEAGATSAPDLRPPTSDLRPPGPPLFEDLSSRLDHAHMDTPFDDFARQPLLTRKLSNLGPGIAWADLDGDRRDDLLISGGKDGRAVILHNKGEGALVDWTNRFLAATNSRDQTGILAWRGADGRTRIVVGESNWEDANSNAPPFRVLVPQDREDSDARTEPQAGQSATGPLALADVDGDGDLDLFVGGRAVPARYPEAAISRLWRNEGERFSVERIFPDLGLVSGATFTDLDGDGWPELVLACDWGPIRIFRNQGGQFVPWNPPLSADGTRNLSASDASTLASLKGWWNGVGAGDFDGDGNMDVVATNWGRNWRTDQPPSVDLPVVLFYGEFAADGVVQTLITSTDSSLGVLTPWRERQALARAIPVVAARLPSFHAYGRASIQEVLGEEFASARHLQANTPDSMVFLNRGNRFEAHVLPIQAQFSPAFGVSVADFDGDGNDDLFLAQNFFGVDAETSRQDAGTGLVALGDGRGGFRALGPSEAGIAIHGEQRSSAVGDFDGDGRPDLAVAQHAGPMRLFRNARGAPGVRVAVRGPAGNPDAVGASLRLRFGERSGPAREIRAGSGYWSQDSATIVLAAPLAPTAVGIRWPGGVTQEWPWPAEARSVLLTREGVTAH